MAAKTGLPVALEARHSGTVGLATDAPEFEHVPVDDIRADGGTQMRAGLNRETVEEYAEAMREQDGWGQFPPAVVYHDGTTYWLADGFHRVAAAKAAGLESAPAKIHAGDRRAAILHAAGANADHGLRRTNADKWRSVETLLADREWNGWSDRDIARACHVSNTFVGNVRAKLGDSDRPQYAPPPLPVDSSLSTVDSENTERTYKTKHGTTATMNTANIGRKPEPEPKPTYAPVWLLETAIKEWMRKAGYGDHDLLLNKLIAKTSGVNTTFGELQAELLRQSIHHRKHDLLQAINNVISQRSTAARQAEARAVYVEPEPAPAAEPMVVHHTPPDLVAAGYTITPAADGLHYAWVDADGEVGDTWSWADAVADARKRIELAPPTPAPETARADDDRWPALKAAGYTYKHVGKDMWAIVHPDSGYESAWRYDPADCIPLAATHHADEQAAIAEVAAELAGEDEERAERDAMRAAHERTPLETAIAQAKHEEPMPDSETWSVTEALAKQPIHHPRWQAAIRQATTAQIDEAYKQTSEVDREKRERLLARKQELMVAQGQARLREVEAALTAAAHNRVAAWLAQMPPDLDAEECLQVLEAVKPVAQRLSDLEQRARLLVPDALRSWSHMINDTRRRMKHAD